MLRGSGLVPAAYLLAAVGLDAVLQKMCLSALCWPRPRLGAHPRLTATFYFAVYPTLPNLYLEYMVTGSTSAIHRCQRLERSPAVRRHHLTPGTVRSIRILPRHPQSIHDEGRVAWTF